MDRRTFLKHKVETLAKLERKAQERIHEIQSLIYSLKEMEMDTIHQLELIRQALGMKKARRCKLYRPINREKARCLYWTPQPLPKKTLFQVYCSTCEVSGMELKLLKEKLMGRR